MQRPERIILVRHGESPEHPANVEPVVVLLRGPDLRYWLQHPSRSGT